MPICKHELIAGHDRLTLFTLYLKYYHNVGIAIAIGIPSLKPSFIIYEGMNGRFRSSRYTFTHQGDRQIKMSWEALLI